MKPRFLKIKGNKYEIRGSFYYEKPIYENDYKLVPVGVLANGEPRFEIQREALYIKDGEFIFDIIRDDYYEEDQQISRNFYIVKF